MKRSALIVLIGLVMSAIFISSGWANTITIKLGYTSEGEIRMPGTGRSVGILAMVDYIERNSEGAIKFQLHPASALGNTRTMMEQCQTGVIQMVSPFTNALVPFAKEVGVTQIPYIFKNSYVAWKVMNGPFGKELSKVFLDKSGLRVLAWGEGNGYRNLYSRKKLLKTAADLKGVKIRVPPNPGLMAMFKALGSKTVTISWKEIYTGMQTGMAEACETELVSMHGKKLYEVVPFVTMTNHGYNLHPYIINEKFFKSLPEKYQALLAEGAMYGRDVQNAYCQVSALKVVTDLESQGVKFYYPTEKELAQFKRLTQKPYMDITRKKIGDNGQLWIDKILAATNAAEEKIKKKAMNAAK